MPTREQEAWPKEVWLNRFTDLPLEWWGNPSTVGSPEPIAGTPVEAQRYLPAQSIAPLVEALEEISEDICGWSGRSVECVDNPARPASDWCLRCIAAQALSGFKAHTQPEESEAA